MARNPSITAKTLVDVTNPEKGGLHLGAMTFGEDGNLIRRDLGHETNFQFAFMDYQFAVKAMIQPEETLMQIRAVLGYLPYTAESASLRVNMRAIVGHAASALGGRMHVSDKQLIILEDDIHFDESLTPNALLTKTVQFLLQAKPYLELLSLVGLAADVRQRAVASLPPPEQKMALLTVQ